MVTGWSPLAISLWVSWWASLAALVVGFAIAWLLVKTRLRGKWLMEGATLLALVLPPTVVGYYLLLLFGQQGLGPLLQSWFGMRIVFAWPGAALAASVAAVPLVVQTVRIGLANISLEIEDAARVDGCNRWQLFTKIDLPLAWKGIAAGGLLGFLRAIGEFGASLMVAGNIPGRTQTLSMAVYDAVQANDIGRANSLAVLLSLIAFGTLVVVLRLNRTFERIT
jgi:molybdate transport system permease protein